MSRLSLLETAATAAKSERAAKRIVQLRLSLLETAATAALGIFRGSWSRCSASVSLKQRRLRPYNPTYDPLRDIPPQSP